MFKRLMIVLMIVLAGVVVPSANAQCDAEDYLETRNELLNEALELTEQYQGAIQDNSLNAAMAFEAAMDYAQLRRDAEDLESPDCAVEDQRLLTAYYAAYQDFFMLWSGLLDGKLQTSVADDLVNPAMERIRTLEAAIVQNAEKLGWR